MKKQVIISSLIAVAILGSTGIAISSKTANAEPNSTPLVATTNLSTPKPVNSSKNETVYVLTDENGNSKSKFIGSTIYDGAEELPFNVKITYYLDGQEISGKDLAGKSGHVKIVYSYNSTAKYQGKFVPFLAVTGITLDSSKFSNIKLENGKIISETEGSYIITGYSLAGVNADLNTDLLPESFTLEADVVNFKLENTYTVLMNELIADLDTSKLSDLDGIVSSLNQLSDGVNKIVNGATDLSNGLGTALDGTKKLYDGSKALATGTEGITTNITALSDKLNSLSTNLSAALRDGASDIFKSIFATTSSTITDQISAVMPGFSITLTEDNYKTKLDNLATQIPTYAASFNTTKASLEKIENFCQYLNLYTSGIDTMATMVPSLVEGSNKVSAGAAELSKNLGSLVEGQTKLYEGSVTLKDGLTTLKTSGIDKLVNFANKDLASFTRNARSTVSAAASYKSFGGVDAKSVKFIIKTPSI